MTDSKDDENLSALEAEVEAARARLNDSLQNLTRPSISEAVKHDIRSYAETVKEQVVEKINTTRDQLVSSARDASRRQVHSVTDSLRERAAANPLALVLIGAGIGWRLYRHPPIATLLVGAGAASLLMTSTRRAARHFDEYHNPYRGDHPASYVPGGVAGYGYPIEEQAPAPSLRQRAASLGEAVEQKAGGIAAAVSDTASDLAARVSDTASDLAARVSDRASHIAAQVSHAADAGRTRVAETASAALDTVSQTAGQVGEKASAAMRSVRGEPEPYGEPYRRSSSSGRYGMLLGAMGLSLAAIAVGALRAGTVRRSSARPLKRRQKGELRTNDGSFATSEDAFIATLRDSNPNDPDFIENSAIATEDIVGDTEPATRGGEVREGKESDAAKGRGRKRVGSGE